MEALLRWQRAELGLLMPKDFIALADFTGVLLSVGPWVLETADYDGGDPPPFIDLGKLKGNVGGQNYELPPEYDPAIHQYVLIWCERFSTPFAAAPLA